MALNQRVQGSIPWRLTIDEQGLFGISDRRASGFAACSKDCLASRSELLSFAPPPLQAISSRLQPQNALCHQFAHLPLDYLDFAP
jgi:hypothetical protein